MNGENGSGSSINVKKRTTKSWCVAYKGFYVEAGDADRLKAEFLDQLNQCWLYCPDEVIRKGYAFLDTVHARQRQPDEAKEKAMGDFVVSIRRDLLSRKLIRSTALTEADFRHLKVNQ